VRRARRAAPPQPILLPKLQIRFADFPGSPSSKTRGMHPRDLLRRSVRAARARKYAAARGFHGSWGGRGRAPRWDPSAPPGSGSPAQAASPLPVAGARAPCDARARPRFKPTRMLGPSHPPTSPLACACRHRHARGRCGNGGPLPFRGRSVCRCGRRGRARALARAHTPHRPPHPPTALAYPLGTTHPRRTALLSEPFCFVSPLASHELPLLLPPRSALGRAPGRLAAHSSRRAPRLPTRRARKLRRDGPASARPAPTPSIFRATPFGG